MPCPAAIADFAGFDDALAQLRWPEGPFDPFGAWTLRYSVRVTAYLNNALGSRRQGSLTLRRSPNGAASRIDVVQNLALEWGAVHHQKAALRCANDAVSSLLSWSLDGAIQGGAAESASLCALYDEGSPEPGPLPLTCGWSLMDGVMRLPQIDGDYLHFELLDELQIHRPEQRLAFLGAAQAELAGASRWLFGYQHRGRGVLPTQYWLEEGGRLVLARSATRLLMLEAVP